MSSIKSYRDLEVWQKARRLTLSTYKLLDHFPNHERFELVSQMKRCSVSVPSNIAEGQGKKSTGSFNNHLNIAYGSLMELETQLILSNDLDYIKISQLDKILESTQEVGRMINGLQTSILKKPYSNKSIFSRQACSH